MQTNNGRKIDNYWNRYDPAKSYTELLLRDGYGTQASEMNELQSIFAARLKSLGDSLYKDGDIILDAQITVNARTGQVVAEAGLIYLAGAIWPVKQASLVIPTRGSVAVGIRLKEEIVSELEDPALYNPAIGSRGEGEPGAWRRKVEAVWTHDGDASLGNGDFYPVHAIDDGVPRARETPPNLDSFNQGIARYDRDSTGGGTYVCSGLVVRQAEDAEGGAQIYTVSEGRCRVNGFGVELQTSRRVSFDARPDLRFVDTEVIEADGSPRQRINVAHPPIHSIAALRVTLEKTASIVHGSYSGCSDALPDTSVMSIVEVRQGDTVYEPGTDYKRTGDAVDWFPPGNEPAPGSTIQVKYTYLDKSLEPEDLDYDGFFVSGAVAGSGIMVSYNQALPRIDRLCLSCEGVFSWVQGVPAEYNAKSPAVPETLLAVASVRQTWRSPDKRQVINDGIRVYSFSDLEMLNTRLEYALGEIARQRLESDAATREAGAKVGLAVDPLLDDSMRDQGIEQTAAIVNGFLTLPITASAYGLSDDILKATARNFSVSVLINQPLRTGAMKVNPYMAFAILPGRATLTPAVDRWLEQASAWTSPVTRSFYRQIYAPNHPQHGQTVRDVSWSTEMAGTTQQAISHLRQIDVAFTLEGFGPGENLTEISFDGVSVQPKDGPLTADAEGKMAGVFTIPPNIPAGAKLVEFRGNGSTAQATFVGQGTLEVTTYRSVQTVTNTNIDPLAQTFTLDAAAQVAGADLWFTAKGPAGVRVQLRECSNGLPTRTVLAEAIVPPENIVVTGGGHTRILFDAPVALAAGTEYALVILCNDADTALAVAEMGEYDATHQQWVAAQSYVAGVLLSSSNASTWTAHQARDLTFRLLGADFASGVNTLTLGAATVQGATDLILLALAETPSSQSRVEYELTLPDGSIMTVAEDQPVRLPAAQTGQIQVKAKLSGDVTASPVLWPGSQILAGSLESEGTYYARSVKATGATKAILIYCAEIPSGASVVPEIQLDGGEWRAMTPEATTPQGNGYVEYTFSKTIAQADMAKLRLTLKGTISARPMLYDLRFMTV
ncbi:DUF4815 domain-containing protein [Desulfovibrio sp. ZJ200]|uniref:DUF4815 domain-containing protein n=1 Tax=Desulfovibrio sp. ZJ200 TaxID=2709792 RepID=UPI0013EC1AED|nr:DUF4815 domain-containing protein [Desulfovibrio sp. ZJ200]